MISLCCLGANNYLPMSRARSCESDDIRGQYQDAVDTYALTCKIRAVARENQATTVVLHTAEYGLAG
ncbi:hypothetical protein GN244_ATG16382 [Phytophthora infestans]|uniref:Uncharacterized protein n=1 Tax=Phytophthora infestans TaxID=4787 RepID=A0A833S3G7_PHYIN|nr:hypothetical protein GN244_ATG16382 [Phytophthora infestans]